MEMHTRKSGRSISAEEVKTVREVLKELRSSKYAGPFLMPVNTKNFQDYTSIITHPMDLSTISRTLELAPYGADQLISDVKLMFSNCRMYNAPGQPILQLCTSLEREFGLLMRDRLGIVLDGVRPSLAPRSKRAASLTQLAKTSDHVPRAAKKKKNAPTIKNGNSSNVVGIALYGQVAGVKQADPCTPEQRIKLAVPMAQCGFVREVVIKQNGLTASFYKDVNYTPPKGTGKKLRSLEEVVQFLPFYNAHTFGLKLSVKNFSFNADIVLGEALETRRTARKRNISKGNSSNMNFDGQLSKVICFSEDISKGKEPIPVRSVNYVNDTPLPNFEYITESLYVHGASVELDTQFLPCCTCTDGCIDVLKCECARATHQYTNGNAPIYSDGQLSCTFALGIYECNDKCACAIAETRRKLADVDTNKIEIKTESMTPVMLCQNRVVQRGLRYKFEIFMTEDRGWGVRPLQDLPRGAFVCEYIGEVMPDKAADRLGRERGDEYLVDLDFIECCDGNLMKEGFEEIYGDLSLRFELEKERRRKMSRGKGKKSTTNSSSNIADEATTKMKENLTKFTTQRLEGSNILTTSTPKITASEASTRASIADQAANEADRIAKEFETSLSEAKEYDEDLEIVAKAARAKATSLAAVKASADALANKLHDEDWARRCAPRLAFFGDGQHYSSDAKFIGNLGRFLNTSCDPNLVKQRVFWDHGDARFPHLAFMTVTDVRAGTELNWDYGYVEGAVDGRSHPCRCGADNCRGRLY